MAPDPRSPSPSEKVYQTILPDGAASEPRELPCWIEGWRARKELATKNLDTAGWPVEVEEPEVFMSVVVPAFNEEERMGGMLEEAVEFLEQEYGGGLKPESKKSTTSTADEKSPSSQTAQRGWEILIISDGSTDRTVETALAFAKEHQLSQHPVSVPSPWHGKNGHSTHIPHGSIRVIQLDENRGKGGAVTHGMRHVRGRYAVFADADGASRFEDLGSMVKVCQELEDSEGRAVAIGSRAHLVGSEAVVKVCMSFTLYTLLLTSHPALTTP